MLDNINLGIFFACLTSKTIYIALYWCTSANNQNLLPRPYLHIPLEQVTRNDEMLDLIRALVDACYT